MSRAAIASWGLLAAAIVAEVCATATLKANAAGFRWPLAAGAVAGYAASLACLSLALRHIGMGTAYATWSGCGIALTVLIGALRFGEPLSGAQCVSLALVAAGVVGLQAAAR